MTWIMRRLLVLILLFPLSLSSRLKPSSPVVELLVPVLPVCVIVWAMLQNLTRQWPMLRGPVIMCCILCCAIRVRLLI